MDTDGDGVFLFGEKPPSENFQQLDVMLAMQAYEGLCAASVGKAPYQARAVQDSEKDKHEKASREAGGDENNQNAPALAWHDMAW